MKILYPNGYALLVSQISFLYKFSLYPQNFWFLKHHVPVPD